MYIGQSPASYTLAINSEFEHEHEYQSIPIFPRKGGGGGGEGGGDHFSGGGEGGGGRTGSSSSSSPGVHLSGDTGITGKTASVHSSGGGKPFTISGNSPFKGRLAGGGNRGQIYGTSRYGSGYPYGGSGTYIDNRPLPFVFYPVPIYPNYYGSDTYANVNDTQRPGGNITVAIIVPKDAFPSTPEIYRIIGDQLSVSSVLSSLVGSCNAQNTSLVLFNATADPGTYPLPEQMVQWYRASSFGLSLDPYNNSASLPSNMPSSNSTPALPLIADTPLPALNQTWLHCLNTTIAASLPLVDPPPKLSAAEIIQAVFLGLTGLSLCAMVVWFIVEKAKRDGGQWVRGKVEVVKANLAEKKRERRERKEREAKKVPPKRQYSTLEDVNGGTMTDSEILEGDIIMKPLDTLTSPIFYDQVAKDSKARDPIRRTKSVPTIRLTELEESHYYYGPFGRTRK